MLVRSRSTCVFAFTVALIGYSFNADAQARYTITDLGTLGGSSSAGLGVNESGEVVGWSVNAGGASRGFHWVNGTMTDLGTLGGSRSQAFSINNTSRITGFATMTSGALRGFLYENGSMSNIGTLGSTTEGKALNNLGQIVGYSLLPSPSTVRHAFLYSGGSMSDLGTLGGTNSTAYGINDSGDVVGESDIVISGSTYRRAFLYRGGSMSDLGTLGGGFSAAYDINNAGQVTGYAQTAAVAARAFLYNGGSMTDLGVLSGDVSSAGLSLNRFGDVVGYSRAFSQVERALLRTGGITYDLATLIPSGSGWTLSQAAGINDRGQIAGFGRHNGASRGFLLTPVHSLTASPSSVTSGNEITVNWSAPGAASDAIGFYRVGAPDTSMLWWRWTGGAPTGNLSLPAPSSSGQYEFRYFVNGDYTRVAVSNIVTVSAEAGNFAVTGTPTQVYVGGDLTVSWTVDPGRPANDWVGLYRVGDPNESYVWWSYTQGTQTGSRTLIAPLQPGTYEFRYLVRNGFSDAAKSAPITVNPPPAGYSLSASPTTVSVGQPITVEWVAPDGHSRWDWVAVYRVGAAARNYIAWLYTGPATVGVMTFTAPGPPGQYEFRILINNGFVEAARSNPVTVNP